MGHSSIRVTLDLYGHLFPDANRGVLASLDELTTGRLTARRNETPSTPHGKRPGQLALNEKVPVSRGFESGSDGTRTRDLRRDRPAF